MSKTPRTKLQAITVCIFFSDYLKYCISNRQFFDKWLIVTVDTDFETIELCKRFSLDYCFTKRVYQMGASFAKGRAINDGLRYLKKEGWILHIDCDIILPRHFRQTINSSALTKETINCLFGLRGRRALCAPPSHICTNNFEDYQKFHQSFQEKTRYSIVDERQNVKFLERDFVAMRKKFRISTKAGPVKKQWALFSKNKWDQLIYTFEGGEFQHLGYFQLCHSKYFEKYPERSANANYDDLEFRERFPEENRKTLEIDCVHIGLPKSGQTYAQLLDAYLYNVKTTGKFAYLNELKAVKKKYASKLTYRLNEHTAISKDKFFLLQGIKTKTDVTVPGNGWKIWNESIANYSTQIREIRKKISVAYEFFPNPKSEWFAFSIEPKKFPFDKSGYNCLYFELMITGLDCNLEVGFGGPQRTEWLRINTKKLKAARWYQFKIEFSQKEPINKLHSLFVVRSAGFFRTGKISVANLFYTKIADRPS
jgi:hypothetical protein